MLRAMWNRGGHETEGAGVSVPSNLCLKKSNESALSYLYFSSTRFFPLCRLAVGGSPLQLCTTHTHSADRETCTHSTPPARRAGLSAVS